MQSLKIGEPAPSVTLPDLQGRLHVLSDYLGQILLLYFWSATCPHSERADRALSPLLNRWGQRVIALRVACAAGEPVATLETTARRRSLPIILHDFDQSAATRFGVQVTPHFFVLDANGILRYQGAFDDVSLTRSQPTRCYLQDAVEALLRGGTPQPAEIIPFGCTIGRI